jgi:hypothetical protein
MPVNHCVVDNRKERQPELFIRSAPYIFSGKNFVDHFDGRSPFPCKILH